MTKRNMVRIEPISVYGGEGWKFVEFIDHLIAAIPFEYRDVAMVEFESGSYDYSGKFIVYYEREETDQEIADRELRDKKRAEVAKASEYARYKYLKKKFEEMK